MKLGSNDKGCHEQLATCLEENKLRLLETWQDRVLTALSAVAADKDALFLLIEPVFSGIVSAIRDAEIRGGTCGSNPLLASAGDFTRWLCKQGCETPAIVNILLVLRQDIENLCLTYEQLNISDMVVLSRILDLMVLEAAKLANDYEREFFSKVAKKDFDQLSRERSYLAAVLDQLPLGIAIMEAPSGEMLTYNKKGAEIISFSGEPVAGVEDYFEHFGAHHPDGQPYLASEYPIAKALWGHAEENHEMTYRRGDGSLTLLSVNAGPVYNDKGDIIAGVCIFQDILQSKIAENERVRLLKQFEEQKSFLEEVFRISPAGIMLVEAQTGRVISSNIEADRIFGSSIKKSDFDYSKQYDVWRTHGQVLDKTRYPLVRAALKGEQVVGEELYRICPDGSRIYIVANAAPVYNKKGKIIAAVSVFHDITSRKLLADELLQAKELAEKSNQTKSAFLANVSHEIRTPLAAILGASEILGRPQTTDKSRKKFLEIIQRNANSLTVLINDILDLAKVEAGHLAVDYTNLQLPVFISEVIESLSLKTHEKGLYIDIDIAPDVPECITTDSSRLTQILLNLIGNAIKYTETGGILVQVSLVAALSSDQESKVMFTIKDTGCGIAEDQFDELFQVFSQIDCPRNRRGDGTGLGLALSKSLANLLGGDVKLVESRLGVGSAFALTINSNTHNSKSLRQCEKAINIGEEIDLSDTKVLVVDDDLDNRVLLQQILSLSGAEVKVASNGREAINLALSDRFDLVFMDVQMPVLDGYKATLELRRQGFDKPIIALSGLSVDQVREKSLQMKCDDHLVKPVAADHLLRTVARFIGR